MSKLTNKITRTIRSEQVLNAFVRVVRRNLPLDLKNTRITAEDIIYALAHANVHRLSIASACQELRDAPSGNRLREVVTEAVPDRAGAISYLRFLTTYFTRIARGSMGVWEMDSGGSS